jgi:Divergent InlB B-repeat domain
MKARVSIPGLRIVPMNARVWRWTVVLAFAVTVPAFGQWIKTYGGPGDDDGFAQPTSDGGYIVVGSTSSFGAAGDAWVLKLDGAGVPQWQRTYGGPASDAASCVQQTADGGFLVAGSTSSFGRGLSDVWVFRLSAAGDLVWQRTYGGSGTDYAVSLALTPAGEAYIAASTASFSYATRKTDFWVIKISSSGDIIWQRQYGGNDADSCASLELTFDGGCIVSGTGYGFEPPGPPYPISNPWILKLGPNGDIQWQKRLGHDLFYYDGGRRALRQTADGGYVVTGYTPEFSQGRTDLYVAKLQPNGDLAWIKTYGTARSEFDGPIVQTQDGGFAVIAGTGWTYQYGEDLFLLKLNAAGDIEWQRGFGGSRIESGSGLHQLPDGRFVFCGSTESFGAGGRDILLVKTSPEGYIDPACPNEAPFSALSSVPYCLVQPAGRTALETGCVPLVSSATSAITSIIPFTQCSAKTTFTLTIAAGPGGATNPAPGSYIYEEGTWVSVQALAATAYQFDNWTGDASGSANPYTVAMSNNKSIQANFSRAVKPPLNLTGEKLVNRAVSMVENVARLHWQANTANTGTISSRIYKVENGRATAIADVAAGTYEYLVRRLQPKKVYRFGVTAVNSQGWESDMVEIAVL